MAALLSGKEGRPGLKLRVVIAFLMVVASITLTTIVLPKAFGGAVDRMTAGTPDAASVAIALVAAFALARFGGVLLDTGFAFQYPRLPQALAQIAELTPRGLLPVALG